MPAPAFTRAEEWVDACFAAQSARGPRHGAAPGVDYGSLWTLWLAVLPYGLWSKRVREPSLQEFRQSVAQLEPLLERALERFGLELAEGIALGDLAAATVNLVEGAWLNQCLSAQDPSDPDAPVAAALQRAGRLLWWGATARP